MNNDVLEPAIQLGMLGKPPLGFVLVDSSFLFWGREKQKKSSVSIHKLFKVEDPILYIHKLLKENTPCGMLV
jgi:hypothetical protein